MRWCIKHEAQYKAIIAGLQITAARVIFRKFTGGVHVTARLLAGRTFVGEGW